MLLLVAPTFARAAQPQAGAALVRLVSGGDPRFAPESSSGHAWVFLPTPNAESAGTGGAGGAGGAGGEIAAGYLVHMVPRQGVPRASAGSVRLVMALKRAPLAISGWNGEAFLLMGAPGDTATGPGLRSLSSIRVSGPMSLGNWDYRPMERLDLRATLPPEATPLSMIGTSAGPVVVWERDGAVEVALLGDDSAWRTLRLPPGSPVTSEAGEVHALATSEGVMLAVRAAGDATLTLWHAVGGLEPSAESTKAEQPPLQTPIERRRARAKGAVTNLEPAPDTHVPQQVLAAKWVRDGVLRLPSTLKDAAVRTIGPSAPFWLAREGGQTLFAERTVKGLTVWRLDSHEAEPTVLWSSGELPADVGVLTVGGLDACTVLAFTPEHGASGEAESGRRGGSAVGRGVPDTAHLRVVDISASTGVVLADVTAHTDGFLSRRELWILWLLFIGVGVVVLLVVVNADGPQEVQLPEGYALATPGRRALAGVLDLAAAIGITSLVVGGTPAQWLSPATSTSSSLVPLVGVVVFAFVLSTIGEALAGASPGKLLVGARVMGLEPVAAAAAAGGGGIGAGVSVKKERGQPTLMRAIPVRFYQALIRNAIRWFMPPMGLAMIADDNWRHPGDQLGKTVVVVRYEAEDDEVEGDEG